MLHSQTHLRSRPIQAGYLQAFEAVARPPELSGWRRRKWRSRSRPVSRQIQARWRKRSGHAAAVHHFPHPRGGADHRRHALLLQAVAQTLPRIDAAVHHPPEAPGASVSVTTFASFALDVADPQARGLPARSPGDRHPHPGLPTPRSTSTWWMSRHWPIPALYAPPGRVPPSAPAVRRIRHPHGQPWLAQRLGGPIRAPGACCATPPIEAMTPAHPAPGRSKPPGAAGSTAGLQKRQPRSWLSFGFALPDDPRAGAFGRPGPGAGARPPLVAENLARGDLAVEVLPGMALRSPMAYWLLVSPRSAARPRCRPSQAGLAAQGGPPRSVGRPRATGRISSTTSTPVRTVRAPDCCIKQ